MSIFKNYFDGIDTSTNTAAECGEIRERASKIKKRRKIASSTLGVTLAVMMTTTVAVSAAGGWDITEIIGRWFKGNTESVMDNLSEVRLEDDEVVVAGNFDIALRGSVADDNMLIVFMDVTKTDGGVFDNAEYTTEDKDGNIYYNGNGESYTQKPVYEFGISYTRLFAEAPPPEGYDFNRTWSLEGIPVRQYVVEDSDPCDNKMTIAFCFDKTTLYRYEDANDSEIKYIELYLGNLYGKKSTLEPYGGGVLSSAKSIENIPFSWKGKLVFDSAPIENVIKIEPNRESGFKTTDRGGITEYDQSFEVTSISVSKISLSVSLKAPAPETDSFLIDHDMAEIILKNGDRINVSNDWNVPRLTRGGGYLVAYSTGDWEENISFMFKSPIDPEDVEAVRVGDTTFPIE